MSFEDGSIKNRKEGIVTFVELQGVADDLLGKLMKVIQESFSASSVYHHDGELLFSIKNI
jgi:hypothetical protein